MNVLIDGEEYVPKVSYSHKRISGIICPDCGKMQSKIQDTRSIYLGTKRRRVCLACGSKWNTIEVML